MIRYWLILFAIGSSAFADKDFSSWRKHTQGRLIAETDALAPGNPLTIGFHVTLEKNWHTYWVNPGDSGTPLHIAFKNAPGLTVKQVHMPVPERLLTGPLVTFGYSNEVLFLVDVEVAPHVKAGDFSAEVEWLVCEDVCIPAFDTVQLSLPVRRLEEIKPSADFALFQKTRASLPTVKENFPKFLERDGQLQLPVADTGDRRFVEFFPFKNSGVNNHKPKVISENPLLLGFEKGSVASESPTRVGLLVLKNAAGSVEAWQYGESGWNFDNEAASKAKPDFWWMLFSAFLGGLILNLMPCVFPVLSIKLLSLLKHAESHPEVVRRENFAYVAGVLVSFLSIAIVLISVRAAGSLVGWGFQLQSPLFLAAMIWLFFALSLNLAGFFEIDFLDSGMGGKLTRMGGMTGSFFTGVLAVIVASPCTAPFMGVALGFGLTQTTPVLLAIFTSLGLGLASPYLAFAIVPEVIRWMPRPGAWMNTLKKVMAVPLLATTVWLAWVLTQVLGGAGLAVVVAVCIVIGIWSRFRNRIMRATMVMAIAVGSFALGAVERSAELYKTKTAIQDSTWLPFREGMPELKGGRVFVDMTADWCLTCKVNERLVFDTEEVRNLFKSKRITLIKGDWTRRNEEITRFLARYERVGVPFYVLYSPRHPEGQVLPEVLSKSNFIQLINEEFPD